MPAGAIVLLDAYTGDVATDPYPTSGFYRPQVQVFSDATSTCDVDIQARAKATAPWVTLVTVSNPTGGTEGGVYYALPPIFEIRVKVYNHSLGAISALLELATFRDFRQVY